MLSEQDRASLQEIEDRFRESDADLVRAFEILGPLGSGRSAGRRGLPAPLPPPNGPLLRAVKGMLAAAVLLSVAVIALAAWSRDGATLVFCVAFSALVGLACYVAATVLRPRRR